jgi:hypothetical protein
MQVGDLVKINGDFHILRRRSERPRVYGQIGIIAELLHAASTLPLAEVMVFGKVDQFYLNDLEIVNDESR